MFQVECLGAETRLDTKRRAFTAYALHLVENHDTRSSSSSLPLSRPFYRRYHQFKQLSHHLRAFGFEHPSVPDSGGLFNTSTTEWLVEQRTSSLVVWLNSLLDTIEITALRGKQQRHARRNSSSRGSSSSMMPMASPKRAVRKAACAIMAFLHSCPEVDPGGDADDISNMPPTPVGSFQGLKTLVSGGGSGGTSANDARVHALNASWSAGLQSSSFSSSNRASSPLTSRFSPASSRASPASTLASPASSPLSPPAPLPPSSSPLPSSPVSSFSSRPLHASRTSDLGHVDDLDDFPILERSGDVVAEEEEDEEKEVMERSPLSVSSPSVDMPLQQVALLWLSHAFMVATMLLTVGEVDSLPSLGLRIGTSLQVVLLCVAIDGGGGGCDSMHGRSGRHDDGEERSESDAHNTRHWWWSSLLVAMMHVVLWWCGDYSAWGGRRLHVCFVAWLLMVASTWRAGDGYW